MYQAIVLLPLLGAIIAGAIALYGAHRRFPGGSGATHGAEDHAAPVREHRSPKAGNVSSVIHETHHEPEEHEPAAEGSRAAEVITTSLLFIAMALSWVAFVRVGFGHYDE